MPSSLILASGSEYKQTLFERLGLDFDISPAAIDEAAHVAGERSPEQNAVAVAAAKARTVSGERDGACVVGSDQIVALDGQRLTKPGGERAAVEQLLRLQGRTHRVATGVALVDPEGQLYTDSAVHEMVMRALEREAIERYVREDSPLDCAGSYRVESRGIRLFRSMRGDDYTAIVGLPLTRVWNTLDRAGYFEDGSTTSE